MRNKIKNLLLEKLADEHAIKFHKWCKNNVIKHTLLGNVESYEHLLKIYKLENSL